MKLRRKWLGILVVALGALACWLVTWQADATVGEKAKKMSLKGIVSDSHGRPLAGATVYFIQSDTIDTTRITPSSVLDGTAEAYDEPLEDIVNNVEKAKLLPQAKTDKRGRFNIKKLNPVAQYYAFVVPDAKDADHIPGGDASRIAWTPSAQARNGLKIHVSWKPPSDAGYIGSSACYSCHGEGASLDKTACKKSGHSLMFKKPGQLTANQSLEAHHAWEEFTNKFTLATDYKTPVAPATAITTLYFQDLASTSPRFVIYENTKGTSTVYLKAYLWKTAANEYKVTLENAITPSDPNNFLTLDIPLTMGGYIRQRLLAKVPGLKGLYPLFSYQAFTGSSSQGMMINYDRSRKPFAEGGSGGGGITSFFDITKKLIIPVPASSTNTVQRCASCHLGAGAYQRFNDPVTGEQVARTVNDPNGLYDIDGDGANDDIGINCEQCHGPGSRHRDEAVKGKLAGGTDNTAKYIVNPKLLGADRASLICGRCHSEINHTDPNNFTPPGTSRKDFLANYVSNKGSALTRFWPDGEHELGGHRGTAYADWLEARHARNDRRLVGCDDCHAAMAESPHRYFLKGDPDDSQYGLCLKCHAVDVAQHVPEKTGNAMNGTAILCINCHMPRIGKGGAGRPGLVIGKPTGAATDENIVYWENDQADHHWEAPPSKWTPGVAGVAPGKAMPIPYTNSCGACHDASTLPYQAPAP